MKFESTYERLKNDIDTHTINTDRTLYSYIIVTIYKGTDDDPTMNGGTYHYLEHILGSYFEYGNYGSKYDHLTNMNGVTLSKYLHIYKKFLFDDIYFDYLMNNIIHFITTKELDSKILDNEKWMVNNETTSKLYDHSILQILFLYEYLQTNRIYSTFGTTKSLNEEVLKQAKNSLSGEDYCIYFVNIKKEYVNKYISILSKIKFNPDKFNYKIPKVITPDGKYILSINSVIGGSYLILTSPDPDLLLYLTVTNKDTTFFEYKDVCYILHAIRDFIIITYCDVQVLKVNIDKQIENYIEAFIYFLNTSLYSELDQESLALMHYISSIRTNPKLKHLKKTNLFEFIYKFKVKEFNKIDFIFVHNDNSVQTTNMHPETQLLYDLKPYNKSIKIDLTKIKKSILVKNTLSIKIDYEKHVIYNNMYINNSKSVYICIKVNINEPYIFFIFYILSNSMSLYYSIYDEHQIIINCLNQREQLRIEQNLKSITYRDIYNTIVQLNSGNVDIINNRNNLFFIIYTMIDKIDLNYIFKREYDYVINDNNYTINTYISSNYKLDINEKTTEVHTQSYYNLLSKITFPNEYLVIKSKSNDIVGSYVFVQYIYEIMNKLRVERKIYMCNFKSSISHDHFLILIYAQVKNLKQMVIDLFYSLKDIIDDINFAANTNVILIGIIKLMIFLQIDVYKSKFDLNDINYTKMFITKTFKETIY